ncbi:hypothetical protein AX774_g677 [Zancudomyces culisetae]|uniref:Uncharacterized protein n=1 Tax=Zancudomyces culisetae TaxID=1213189 RepID=A0A1R1PXR1_ZANCU|nr:hypothetical protein AX774_g677 [Zancudomyces culisetae]|eukprot:OMH85764.1 hypothetical protein AX774_g677 [Zancudomyces culisetae]
MNRSKSFKPKVYGLEKIKIQKQIQKNKSSKRYKSLEKAKKNYLKNDQQSDYLKNLYAQITSDPTAETASQKDANVNRKSPDFEKKTKKADRSKHSGENGASTDDSGAESEAGSNSPSGSEPDSDSDSESSDASQHSSKESNIKRKNKNDDNKKPRRHDPYSKNVKAHTQKSNDLLAKSQEKAKLLAEKRRQINTKKKNRKLNTYLATKRTSKGQLNLSCQKFIKIFFVVKVVILNLRNYKIPNDIENVVNQPEFEDILKDAYLKELRNYKKDPKAVKADVAAKEFVEPPKPQTPQKADYTEDIKTYQSEGYFKV